MYSKKNKLYRPCVGGMIINQQNKVLVGKRIVKSSTWQMPQGGIDNNESTIQAIRREIAEEIGTTKISLLAQYDKWLYYDVPEEFNYSYCGQKQKWFLFKFTGYDIDIDLNTTKPEFVQWKWQELDMLVQEVAFFKREVYTKIIAVFKELICKIPHTG